MKKTAIDAMGKSAEDMVREICRAIGNSNESDCLNVTIEKYDPCFDLKDGVSWAGAERVVIHANANLPLPDAVEGDGMAFNRYRSVDIKIEATDRWRTPEEK